MLSSAPVASATPCGRSAALFDRLPERLVLEGFRRWISGYATGDLGHWEEAWNLHAAALGPRSARSVVDSLAKFVRVVRDWSLCPVSCFPGNCRHICRHECFALAMVAASQNQDLDCLASAMRHLLDPEGHEEAAVPCSVFCHGISRAPPPSSVTPGVTSSDSFSPCLPSCLTSTPRNTRIPLPS
jgi:hypothetical protein